ncbi:MAG: hypothetical protein PHZ00_04675 [Candidatus Peribacteraceae bacterium]|nr:hypothetical protein [Candidatus Peribacteraceae bacterium]
MPQSPDELYDRSVEDRGGFGEHDVGESHDALSCGYPSLRQSQVPNDYTDAMYVASAFVEAVCDSTRNFAAGSLEVPTPEGQYSNAEVGERMKMLGL